MEQMQIALRVVIICNLLFPFKHQCLGLPVSHISDDNDGRQELLRHFNPTLNDEKLTQVNSLLEQLHQHASKKRNRNSSKNKIKSKAAWDLESNVTVASLSETDQENVTVDKDQEERLSANSPVPAFMRKYLFEGDILLSPEQATRIVQNVVQQQPSFDEPRDIFLRRQKRTALISGDSNRWKSMPIRYLFDVSLDEEDKQPITDALEFWRTHTCIWFQYSPGATDGDLISFFKGNGCYSMIGKMGGKQGISIGDGCGQLGVAAHEVGHALGMWHEQSRPDSNQYIRVLSQNVIDGTLGNFLSRSWGETETYGVPYDLGSVMHYGPGAFSLDPNKLTIETVKMGFQGTIGQRQQPSFLDVKAINKAYCDNRCPSPLPCQYSGYTHPLSCDRCLCPDGLTGTYCERPADSRNANCGGIIGVTGDWTEITSPNYPGNYGKDQRCTWLLRAVPGAQVQLEFVGDFRFYCTATCYDYVEVKNDTDFTNTGMRFCCNTRPTDVFYSRTNEMLIIFNSQTGSDIGFKAHARQYPLPPATTTTTSTSTTTPTTTSTSTSTSTPTSTSTSTSTTSTTMSTSTSTSTVPSTTTATTTTASTTVGTTTTAATTTASTSTVTTTFPSTSTAATTPTTSISSSASTTVPTTTSAGPEARQSMPGAWSLWSDWSECSKSCGACGLKSRQRECLDGSCKGDARQYKRCPFNVCPGDTTCSKLTFLDFPCGGDGKVCSSAHEVTVKCNFPSCCAPFMPGKTKCEAAWNPTSVFGSLADGLWEQWSEWGECFGPKCGGCARQVRHRVCQEETCRGDDREFRPCNTNACTSCTKNSNQDIVEAPCLDRRKEICLRPKRDSEVTCPCCAPFKEKNGKCV